MRHLLLLTLTSTLALAGQAQSNKIHAQSNKTQTQMQTQTTRKFFAPKSISYTTLVRDMHTIRSSNAADTIKPTVSTRLASLYVQRNVLPTDGSVALIYKLNPQLQSDKPIPTTYQLRTPHFTPAPQALLMRSQQEYARLKVPNPNTNERFRLQTNTFNTNFTTLTRAYKFDKNFVDTSSIFSNTVLPGINQKSASICEAQMQYFNTELGHINDLIISILSKDRRFEDVVFSITQMMGDFMEITGWQKPTLFKARKTSGRAAAYTKLNLNGSETTYSPWDNPPNADIYVFTTDHNGIQQSEPSMNTYDVYYDSNGFIFSLTAGCDTVSFFSYHPQNPASTLPVILGKGNYCFVLRNRQTGRIYLQPDINLAVEGKYDDKNRIIIAFTIDN